MAFLPECFEAYFFSGFDVVIENYVRLVLNRDLCRDSNP